MQHEITRAMPLLDRQGNLTEPGYAKKLLPVYRRRDIRAGKSRIKEWDYYLINNGRFALALTIADNSYMGLDSVSLLDFEEGWEVTKSPMSVFTFGRVHLPESSTVGSVRHGGKGYSIAFENDGKGRRVLTASMDDFRDGAALSAEIELTDEPEESMVIATPFDKPGHFYFNQKINCLRARGQVRCGERVYTFDPADSFAVLDWGRGVWTYHNTWYWGSASGQVDGVPFGFNLGYGFGNTAQATENMLFYNGKAHKLNHVKFYIPGDEKDFLSPWRFSSDNGRFTMDFRPVLDRASCTDLKLIKSDQHQVFGFFTGTAILDDGTPIDVRDFPGFAEKVENKW